MLFVRPTFMGTLRWDNFCNFGATLLRFGTLFTNIILLWIRNSEKNWTTPTPQKNQKKPKKRLMDFQNGITCQPRRLRSYDNFYKMFKPSDYYWVFVHSLGIITSLLRKYLGCKKSFYAIFKFFNIILIVMHCSIIPHVANVSHISTKKNFK